MPGLKLGKEAQSKFEEAKQSPDKAGPLEKKGAKRKNWNDRWFVLKDNYLFYCKNEKSNPQGIINLHGCTVSQIQGPTARSNGFSLLAPKSVSIDAKWTNRTYFMAAKSPKEMQIWMEKLEENGKKAVERAQARKAEQVTPSSPAATQPTPGDSDSSSDDEKPSTSATKGAPAAKKIESSDSEDEPPMKKEDIKIKQEEPIKKEEPIKQSESVQQEEIKKSVDPEEERELPSSPTINKSKREKKEKKSKKSKKEKKSKSSTKKKTSDSEEEKPTKPSSSSYEKKKQDSDASESEEEKPVKKQESDEDSD